MEHIGTSPMHADRSRLMRELARFALDFCARKGFERVYGHVRNDLVPAWKKMFGAHLLESRSVFSFSDVEYREMVFDLPPHEVAILSARTHC